MKLTIFNGSPRGEGSNTKVFLEHFLNGFTQTPGNSFEAHYLKDTAEHSRFAGIFNQAEAVMLAFPLYTDAMPGIVKAFIEELRPRIAAVESQPKRILFLVQSGFPEAIQIEAVEQYLIKLARRLCCECAGVIVKGGGEGIQLMPAHVTRKIFGQFYSLGETFGQNRTLDAQLLKKICGMKRFPAWMLPGVYLMKLTGLMDFFWNAKLKENNAFDLRFDRPYAPETMKDS